MFAAKDEKNQLTYISKAEAVSLLTPPLYFWNALKKTCTNAYTLSVCNVTPFLIKYRNRLILPFIATS